MSDSQGVPWSYNDNAPKIAYDVYFHEKVYFAGILIASILYGILTALFFKCMAALFNPVYRRGEPVQWGLVSYTVAMFWLVTVVTAMGLNVQSISYIDNREFSGAEDVPGPGPYGYKASVQAEPTYVVPNLMFFINNWLADGLLLYRCYIIYSMNFWVTAFPGLLYLCSLAMGIVTLYQAAVLTTTVGGDVWFGLPFFSLSIFLNVLLTSMIIIRLIRRTRDTRNALGIGGIGGLCKTVVTMLIESCALYAVSSSLVVGLSSSPVIDIFLPVLAETQVIAALLIIQRVANRSALTSKIVVSGHLGSLRARTQGSSTDITDAPPGDYTTGSADEYAMNPGELGVEVETATNSYRD